MRNSKQKRKVLLGMSGGVDSSVSAVLLKKRGYDVIGGFIKNWSDTKDVWSGECQWRGDRRDAMRVAAKLDIPLVTFDFEDLYRRRVVDRMFKAYARGVTPNPDVLCNQEIKFGVFARAAKTLKADVIATGHYARVRRDTKGVAHLLRGNDPDKDQSYFLHRVTQTALRKTIFPVGNMKKSEVKRIARSLGLSVADKKESMGICFIGKQPMKDFLRTRIASKPGDVVDPNGNVIGRHDGLDAVTVGQRHGFRVRTTESIAWYAAAKDLKSNCLIVVPGREHPALYVTEAVVGDLHWISGKAPGRSAKELAANRQPLTAVLRYRQEPVPVTVTYRRRRIYMTFKRPVFAIAPGQSAVLYRGSECLGGGVIE